ncbi:MAG: hypothetical protein WAW96_12200, partial [Alphaproteobacteria bacterium]
MTNPTSQTKFRLGAILGVSALALTLGLAACGQQGASTTTPSSESTTTTTTTPESTTTTAPETATPPASGGSMDSGAGSATP